MLKENKNIDKSIVQLLLPEGGTVVDTEIYNDPMFESMSDLANRRVYRSLSLRDIENNGHFGVITSDPKTRFIIGMTDSHFRTDLTSKVHLASGNEDGLSTYAVLEGPQAYGSPFVGWIETLPGHERQGKALGMLAMMNAVSKAVYDQEVTSGPQSYLRPDGLALQAYVKDKFSLPTNEEGYVVGKPH